VEMRLQKLLYGYSLPCLSSYVKRLAVCSLTVL
jgi:hypothetical protein